MFIRSCVSSNVAVRSWTCVEDILTLAQHPQYQDVTLVCNNGNIAFNSLILASMSPVIRKALIDIPYNDTHEMSTIICPDVEKEEVEHLFSNVWAQTKEIPLSKALFNFLKQLEIDVRKVIKKHYNVGELLSNHEDKEDRDIKFEPLSNTESIVENIKVEPLLSNYESEENEDSFRDLEFKIVSNDEIKMNFEEIKSEHDPIAEFEENDSQEGISILCKIEIDQKSETEEENTVGKKLYNDDVVHQYLARLDKIYPDKKEKNECSKMWKCRKCKKIFTTAGHLKRHLRDTCNEEREKVKCPKCGKALHEVSLKRHLDKCDSRSKIKQGIIHTFLNHQTN